MSVDSRATQGPYIASQSVKKVIEINPFLLGKIKTKLLRSRIEFAVYEQRMLLNERL